MYFDSGGEMITSQELLDDLKRVKNKIGEIPSITHYKKYGQYNCETLRRRFGFWGNILMEVFGENIRESRKPRPTIQCKNCGKKTKNPKFCSQSCNATYNNTRRYGPPDTCKICGKRTRRNLTTCRECYIIYTIKKYGEQTLGKFRKIPSSKNRYQAVRLHAHRIASYYKIESDKCLLCNYSNHLDLCHIKDISSFGDEISLNEINSPDNLVFLCPNHHWDLWHGKLLNKELKVVEGN